MNRGVPSEGESRYSPPVSMEEWSWLLEQLREPPLHATGATAPDAETFRVFHLRSFRPFVAVRVTREVQGVRLIRSVLGPRAPDQREAALPAERWPGELMRRLLVLLCCCFLTAVPVAAQEPREGFPVVVTVLDGATVDSAFLARTAFAVAHRWATPSKQRAAFGDWRRVRERTIPMIPRWSDDWSPNGSQQTSAVLVLRRRGRPTLGPLSPPTGDQLFDASIPSIVRDPMPASPGFPDLPATIAADSIALRVTFGIEPDGAAPGLVRFARFQDAAVAIPGTLRVDLARRRTDGPELRADARIGTAEGLNIIFKFDIDVDGRVDPRSLQLLATNDRDLARLVQEALVMARYSPARTNGQAVRITVIQQFGG